VDRRSARRARCGLEGKPAHARGFRRLELRHPGYFTFYKEVTTQPGDLVVITASCTRLDEETTNPMWVARGALGSKKLTAADPLGFTWVRPAD
jgi:hypothetical protein